MNIDIRGIKYRSIAEKAAARFVEKGDELILRREPDNPVDSNAVRVYTKTGYGIGYIPKEFAQEVYDRIDYIQSCRVIKVNRSGPYIDALIEFSSEKQEPKSFIPKEFQMSPEDRMIRLSEEINNYESVENYTGYNRTGVLVEHTYEFNRQTVEAARRLNKGDVVYLMADGNFIGVYTPDNIIVGHAFFLDENEYDAIKERIVRVHVQDAIEKNGRLFIEIFYTGQYYNPNVRGGYNSSMYPEIYDIGELKKSDPYTALDILLPIAQRERWFEAKHECLKCYRNLKLYEDERRLILKIISIINEATEADLPPFELKNLKNQIAIYNKRLNVVEKRIK